MRDVTDYQLTYRVLSDLGGEVYRTRLERGRSQLDVANGVGLTTHVVDQLERRGSRGISVETVLRVVAWLEREALTAQRTTTFREVPRDGA